MARTAALDTVTAFMASTDGGSLTISDYVVTGASKPFDPQAFLEGHMTPVFFGSALRHFGVMELTYQARQVESYSFKGFEAFTAATLVYLVISVTITALVHQYDRRVLNPLRVT